MKEQLAKVVNGTHLTAAEAADAMSSIMDGAATPAQIAGLLAALRTKGETVDEITGFARVMRTRAIPVRTRRHPLVDTCGTGGDSIKSFNISTAAAIVAAAAGAAIAKHGNRAVTSKAGSADVLEALGVRIDLDADTVGRCVDSVGIGFLFARTHHPAMKYAAPVRAELGIRTVFNVLGPLTNPAGATRQVIGVYDPAWCEPLAKVLAQLGTEHALVVHGLAGIDEIATFGQTVVASAQNGDVRVGRIDPAVLGLKEANPATIAPGADPTENAAILRAVLDGEHGPRRDIVLANAAAALFVAGIAPSLRDGVQMAAAAVDTGAATQKLADLIQFTQSQTPEAP
ncbi:MAG: anthranilate phosphoribosyltransferase, partial [Armatimonadaceae bacterium]|jgi:anthranilate phosphoribosyltransferase